MPQIAHNRLLLALFLLLATGCQEVPFDGPTVDNFDGQLLSEGKPVSFSDGEVVKMLLIHKGSAERFLIPIKRDGSFDIGWMPIGEYLCSLNRKPAGAEPWQVEVKSKPIPGGLQIEEGKTEYEIELGENF